MMQNACFEQGPIRPPSEARSLLIRPTRNCPWNKCAFCHTYRGTRFELRGVDEVKGDIDTVHEIAESVRELSWKLGQGGAVNDVVISRVFANEALLGEQTRHVAVWLYFGGKTVFLQDADSLIMKSGEFLQILQHLKEKFPEVDRVTTYCRSKTASHKSVEDLRAFRGAGLTRIHVGMESGYDPVLAFIRKGTTAAEHIKGGTNIVEAGISLCEYVMPGLGGQVWSREHALETAKVLNAINPDHIRFRTLAVRRGTTLYELMQEGKFQPIGDEDILREIRLLIETLDVQSRIVSDHILNLLEDLEGKLPEDREKMLGLIDRYFALPEMDRLVYRLGRRRGIYRSLDDLSDRQTYARLKDLVEQYKGEDPDGLDRDLDRIRQNFI